MTAFNSHLRNDFETLNSHRYETHMCVYLVACTDFLESRA